MIAKVVESLLFSKALVRGKLVDAGDGISNQFLVHLEHNIYNDDCRGKCAQGEQGSESMPSCMELRKKVYSMVKRGVF